MHLRFLSLIIFSFSLTGCANFISGLVPDVYLVDRRTLMEADAAGEWPDLEQRLQEQAVQTGSTPYAGAQDPLDQQLHLKALNAEYAQPSQN